MIGSNPDAQRREAVLLGVLASRQPGTSAIVEALRPEKPSTVRARLDRMKSRHVLVRVGRAMWAVAGQEGERPIVETGEGDASESLETSERVRPPFNPRVWAQHIDFYVRTSTSLFDCRRFG
jgi:hypothetical protein